MGVDWPKGRSIRSRITHTHMVINLSQNDVWSAYASFSCPCPSTSPSYHSFCFSFPLLQPIYASFFFPPLNFTNKIITPNFKIKKKLKSQKKIRSYNSQVSRNRNRIFIQFKNHQKFILLFPKISKFNPFSIFSYFRHITALKKI